MQKKLQQKVLRDIAKGIVRTYFKDDDGNAFEMTDTQADIFNMIFYQAKPRCQVLTSTQYGKSTIVAMALIITSQVRGDDFVVLAGVKEKALIIMDKVIQHMFDHDDILSKFEYDPNEKLDSIRRKRSRDHISWSGDRGGSIKVITANVKNSKTVKDALTGHGSKKIIAEESALIPDEIWGMVMRMLGDVKGTFLLKIGNAVYRNHFYRSANNKNYHVITVDWKVALKEGRYSQEYIDEVRAEMTKELFENFYDCIFPKADAIDENGYRFLFDQKLCDEARIEEIPSDWIHPLHEKGILGSDIGRGGDSSDHVVRLPKVLYLEDTNHVKDTMYQVAKIHEINARQTYVDDIGVGGGVTDRAKETRPSVVGVSWSASATEKGRFANLKAECHWRLYTFFNNGGKYLAHDNWNEMLEIKYKINSSNKIQMESKEEMLARGVKSPNTIDAGALTFTEELQEPKIDFA